MKTKTKKVKPGCQQEPCCVSLLDAETAPHDGTMILADFGWPWLVPAAWSRMSCTWNVAVYNASAETVTSMEVHDCWWEFETEDNRDLKGWMPIPPIPHNDQSPSVGAKGKANE